MAQLLAEQMQSDHNEKNPFEPKGSGKSRQQQVEKLQQKADLIDQWLAENQPR